jgi:hypothetical protein
VTRANNPQPKRLTNQELEHVARGLLHDFKELAGFDTAVIAGMEPIYGPSGQEVEYYEVRFTTPHGDDNGYAIVSATTADFPVAEFNESGSTHRQRFEQMTGRKRFKMTRFGPNYMTAEATGGKLIAEIGFRPGLIPEQLRRRHRTEGRSELGEVKVPKPPVAVRDQMARRGRKVSYQTFRQRYERPRPKTGKLRAAWASALKQHSNPGCVYDYFWADGFANHTYYTQIPKNTPPNNNDHASGCGSTAWMNIFGWHDRNWTPDLLAGSLVSNDPYIEDLTMAGHDYLGTYEPWFTFDADQGFTWPSDMVSGYNFARTYFGQACSYWYRHDWWNTDETWVMEPARDVIRARRPFIVGYFQDWHYAIGYGVAECKTHGWEDHAWIKIYPGWRANDSQDKWIPKGTIFAVYGVYSFFPVLQITDLANPQELEMAVIGPGTANRLLTYTGTAVFQSVGGSGGSWLRGRISFDVGRPLTAPQFKKAIGAVSLASIANDDHAVDAGWAIDNVTLARNPTTGKAQVVLDYAIRDIDGFLYRMNYRVWTLAQL